MNKTFQYFIIGISLASIFFSLNAVYQGQEFMNSVGGIVIGVSLLGVVYFENKKKGKD